MSQGTQILLVAAYQDPAAAQSEFDALVGKVAAKEVSTQGMILVAKGADGKVMVADTGNHLGRKGAGWGGGVGVLVGLFAPPLLASVAVGAAAGAVVGKFAGSKVTEEIQAKVSENLKPGTAVVIGVFPAEQRLEVERALPGSALKSVVESDEKGIDELKRALGEAMGKFAPDRTVLPIPDRAFGGVAGRSIADSVADWSIIAPVKPPEGAPNVLVVLIDDAGFGSIESFGGPVRSPAFTRVQEMGLTYNAFHVTAVCSPTRAALLTGRNHHRVGMGSIVEYPGPFPGYTGALPKSCAPFPRVLKENGYVTGAFGKWHLTPDHVQGAAGPFDRW
ncbi:MAG: sulfatase-like hydrolase/transferase, partial [Candidatus Nanopelagicales bacterium]|nr:sulfatase-like hydrolase/transferase [Candidatus Nanopelagicales bacterium]